MGEILVLLCEDWEYDTPRKEKEQISIQNLQTLERGTK